MFTYRNTTIVFFILLLTLSIFRISGLPVHYYYFILLVAGYLILSVSMSFFIRSGFYMKVFCNVLTKEKMIALTFDDGPDQELTPKLLDHLLDLGIPATFFCIGSKAQENRNVLIRMNLEGHLIGTHSYSHSNWFDLYSTARMRRELEQSASLVFEATGKRPLLFRPPYGVINPMLRRALRGSGFHVIGFSKRAWDTSSRKEKVILTRIIKNLHPGDIILLHDTIPQTIDIIKNLAELLKRAGFQIVSLEKLLNISAYEV